jgi:beta-lactamase regulating signal transducer with metallopeptidase domain
MSWFGMQGVAQLWVERALNSFPEGLLLALFAWLVLRLIGRQNAGTRFAVWFMALIAVPGLSVLGAFRLNEVRLFPANYHLNSQIVVPALWAEVIFAAWAIAASIGLVRLVIGLWQVRKIRKSSAEIDVSQLGPAVEEIFQQHRSGRNIRLAVSDSIRVPAAIGFWKPVIVLPAWTLQELAPAELQPILIHELTHLQRRDDWTNLLQKIVRAIFFFHPAVWWIDSKLSLEREMACDDAVLANTGNPRAYASCLIDLLEKSCARRGWTMAQAAVHRAKDLSVRIAQILDSKRPASTRVCKPALALTIIFSLACFGASYCTPKLVTFGPTSSDSATRMAEIKKVLHSQETYAPETQGTVVPASFHVPSPVRPAQHQASSHKTTQPHTPRTTEPKLVTQYKQQTSAPRVLLTKAVDTTAPAAQMVIFIQTSYVGYGPADNSPNAQPTMPEWNTQLWQILLIAPAQNPSQTEIRPSII